MRNVRVVPSPAEIIGARIKVRLEELGMSVPAFAGLVGVSVQAANRWVRGESLPDRSREHDIALVLDLPWADLFNPRDES